jgi:hypothetical protein
MSSIESINPAIGMLKLYAQLLGYIADVEEKYGKKYDEIIRSFLLLKTLLN